LPPRAKAALAETGQFDAVRALIANFEIDLPAELLQSIFARFGDDPSLRDAMLERPALPAALRARIVVKAAKDLAVEASQWMSPSRAERVAREARDQAICTIASSCRPVERTEFTRALRAAGALTPALLLRSLLGGERTLFTQALAELSGLPAPRELVTAYTISLGTPEAMAEATARASARKLLKIKLGGEGDRPRIAAVRAAAPNAELIVDANEAWRPENLAENLSACAAAGVTLVEQPLPAGDDMALGAIARPIPVCADESVHDRASLAKLVGRYDAVNIKLDKTGGLTEALAMAAEAERLGFRIMVGCMVATSLAMAPAILLAQRAQVVDLDGALLLAKDRPDGLRYEGSLVYPPTPALWG